MNQLVQKSQPLLRKRLIAGNSDHSIGARFSQCSTGERAWTSKPQLVP